MSGIELQRYIVREYRLADRFGTITGWRVYDVRYNRYTGPLVQTETECRELVREVNDLNDQVERMIERPYASACGEADAIQDQLDGLLQSR